MYQLFNSCWALAVGHTDVSVFMAISQSACVPVFALSVCFLHEAVTPAKLAAVTICTAGVVLVSWRQSQLHKESSEALAGLIYSFAYMCLYAVYVLLWGAKIGARITSGTPDITVAVLAAIGTATLLTLWCLLSLCITHRY